MQYSNSPHFLYGMALDIFTILNKILGDGHIKISTHQNVHNKFEVLNSDDYFMFEVGTAQEAADRAKAINCHSLDIFKNVQEIRNLFI